MKMEKLRAVLLSVASVCCAGAASAGDPATCSAVFADDVPDVKFSDVQWADNFRITNIPDFDRPYAVRVVKYWDRKAASTIFDVEFGGERTMICRRGGKYRDAVRRD